MSRAIAVVGVLASYPVAAEAPRRELGAHEHGRGTLNIAIEGSTMTMQLETPGVDIVGFEHAAKSRRDMEAVEKAKSQLMMPLSLFKLPAAAGCQVVEAKVEVEAGHHDHDDRETAGIAKGGEDSKAGAKSAGHSEFHAEYVFECTSASSITTIEFGYFAAFAGAERLAVSVITPKGQSTYEAARANPRISLAGMM
jgi:hypothetical protein